jgi:uncharacterized membrane protein
MRVRTNLNAGAEFFSASPATLSALASNAPFGNSSGAAAGDAPDDFRIGLVIENINQRLRVKWHLDNFNNWREAFALHPVGALAHRLWELDALRGLAVGMMTLFHALRGLEIVAPALAWSAWPVWWATKLGLQVFTGTVVVGATAQAANQARAADPLWKRAFYVTGEAVLWAALWAILGAQQAAGAFFMVSGAALSISHARATSPEDRAIHFARLLGRSLGLLTFGALLTVLSLWLVPHMPVWFGTLHLLGSALVLAYPFLNWPAWASLLGGLAIVGLGAAVANIPVGGPLAALGGATLSLDIMPLFPWAGMVILGVYVAKRLYPNGQRAITLPAWEATPLAQWLAKLGRHALDLYLPQLPILMGLHALFG